MEQEIGLIGFGEAGATFAMAGDWIDAGEDAPSDRLATLNAALAARAEAWRPWRAYGALYWNRVTETADD